MDSRSVLQVRGSSQKTSPELSQKIWLSVDPRLDLRSVSQVTDRSSCPWIDAPKAQLQSQTTVDQHGPSFDPRSIGLTVDRRFRFSASRSRLDRFPISSSVESVARQDQEDSPDVVTDLAAVRPIFHISLLKKCVGDPASIVPLKSVVVKDSLSYEDVPIEILERLVRRLRNKEVASVKVLWRSQSIEGATWEAEATMKSNVFSCHWNSVQLEIQFSVFSGQSTARAGGPWFTIATPPQPSSEKSAKS
ncbi:hypothetical protein MTR67_019076 [Solanum verrucosum]|uniref:Uncharacterized protein n=2 Tax=Solanum verrucosum TaxID=315347 RepID=A0AAF0QRZ7_SOLVR|nr:hypothetical protein MTR67_019076 [Solanum verrucosum]